MGPLMIDRRITEAVDRALVAAMELNRVSLSAFFGDPCVALGPERFSELMVCSLREFIEERLADGAEGAMALACGTSSCEVMAFGTMFALGLVRQTWSAGLPGCPLLVEPGDADDDTGTPGSIEWLHEMVDSCVDEEGMSEGDARQAYAYAKAVSMDPDAPVLTLACWRAMVSGLVRGVAAARDLGLAAAPMSCSLARAMAGEGDEASPRPADGGAAPATAAGEAHAREAACDIVIGTPEDATDEDRRLAAYFGETMGAAIAANMPRLGVLLDDDEATIDEQGFGSLLLSAMASYAKERIDRHQVSTHDEGGAEPIRQYAEQWVFGFVSAAMGDTYGDDDGLAGLPLEISPDMTIGASTVGLLAGDRCDEMGYDEATRAAATLHTRSYYVLREALSREIGDVGPTSWEGYAWGFADGWASAHGHGVTASRQAMMTDRQVTSDLDIDAQIALAWEAREARQ